MRRLRIVDDTGGLLRAPEVLFSADEIGLDAFGHNIENRYLRAALDAQARTLPLLTRIADAAEAIDIAEGSICVRRQAGPAVVARLVIGADGRKSLCRFAAGITTTIQQYPQTALTFNVRHSRQHEDISTEFHTASGPFTLVPLPGRRASLVFVTRPSEATELAALPDPNLAIEIERRSHSILGKITLDPDRGLFPLATETARRFGTHRMALIGEAAHVLPPIGAQGLNLGLRDAAAISELVVAALREGRDIGDEALTNRYEHIRRADAMSRALAVDLLNRSLLSGFLPLHGARGIGLALLDQVGPLRRAVMREGVMPAVAQPKLMRGEAL